MSEVHRVVVGEGGQLFLPADVQAQTGLSEGTELMLLESPGGLVLMTREQLLDRVRSDLAGLDLVGELLADRRSAARIEDAG